MRHISPKTAVAPLPGSLHAQWVRCGKAACRCMNGGAPHGPYWWRYWREGGQPRKAYVPRAALDRTRAAVRLWRLRHPSVRSLMRELRALGRLGKEAALW